MLGNRLREVRISRGLTQDDVAKYLKVRRQTYSAYERNKSLPDANTLGKLASFFSVSSDYLLNIDTNSNNFIFETKENYESNLTQDDLLDLKKKAENIKLTLIGTIGLAIDDNQVNQEDLTKLFYALDEALELAKQETKIKYNAE